LITIQQLRAARGLLGWSQSELAFRAGLSVPTVRRIETASGPRVSQEAREKLRRALEAAGIEFIEQKNSEGAGVRFQSSRRPKTTLEPATAIVDADKVAIPSKSEQSYDAAAGSSWRRSSNTAMIFSPIQCRMARTA